MVDVWGRNRHLMVELAKVGMALRNATTPDQKQGMEDLMVYLALELEKRARFSHYFDAETNKGKPVSWWTRAALQFKIGHKVAREMRAGRADEHWIKQRVEFWLEKAMHYYVNGKIPVFD
ncbi:hypothetical protein HY572_05105 [Candidatus Micrarchaeota archaeon]|nr:hypothetical protein [Candidatus Micrarchaeota archaeon]